jgi:Tfp pilus assembly protein FimT
MVIVILLGVLASVIFVSLQGLIPRAELNSAVRDLSATLFQARSEAISRNAEFKIEYYFEAGDGHPRGYRIVTPFRAGGGEGGLAAFDDERHAMTWHTLPDSIEFQRITLNNEDIDSGQVVVRFDPLGAASDHSITLVQHPYENVYTIEVLALTGLIRFHDGEYEREYPEHGDFN